MAVKTGEFTSLNVPEFNDRRSYFIGCGGICMSIINAPQGCHL